jgi:hypothetical protein
MQELIELSATTRRNDVATYLPDIYRLTFAISGRGSRMPV